MGFVTHTVGGSWTGGGQQVANCSVMEQAAITAAFTFVHSTAIPAVRAFGGLDSLANTLDGFTVASIDLDCRGASCRMGVFGTSHLNGHDLDLCGPALPPSGIQVDTDATVFHELIHCAGGVEIDAWSMENHFLRFHGTVSPDATTFCGETTDLGGGLRAGTFVVWEPASGAVFGKVATGGSWNSGPTITRGNELHSWRRSDYMQNC
ncbi:MAG TPA: hypothetical protein VIH10_15400 [Kribbella sp.]